MRFHLIFAFALSILLHVLTLSLTTLRGGTSAPRRTVMLATLHIPEKSPPTPVKVLPELPPAETLPETLPEPVSEPLVKNTLDTAEVPQKTLPPSAPPPEPPAKKAAESVAKSVTKNVVKSTATKRQIRNAQRKLNEHVYYPQEAINRGLEGEVSLILRLADDGTVLDVTLAVSSGHSILDNAAIRAAYATGRFPGAPREIILPVVFQLAD